MVKIFKISILFVALLFAFQSYSQILVAKKDYQPEARKPRYSFTICLLTGGGSSPVSFGIMRQNPDSTHEVTFLSESSFILQMSGAQKSLANPDQINFFEEFEIDPRTLDNLWMLKYDKYPYGNDRTPGWGTPTGNPSVAQYQMLSEFGINKLHDHCFGENLIHLLIKMNDPMWVGQYQNRR